jgi:succinyl-diaminopimelate desuccinylase
VTHPGTERDDPRLRDRLATLAARLVSIPSVCGIDPESAIVAELERHLASTRCELTLVDVLPGRPSLAAVLEGTSATAPSLVLNGHTDTVPAEGAEEWTVDPFGRTTRDGFVWGRGACDMKSALATMVIVAQTLSARACPLRGSLILHFAAGEERGEAGTRRLLEAGFGGRYGVVLEPTSLRIATAQRGVVSLRVRLHGRSAHTSLRAVGENPIAQLPALLGALERYDRTLAVQIHPLLGSATCTPTIVRAGEIASVVPSTCDVVVDRRLLPGESPLAARDAMDRYLASALDAPSWPVVTIDETEGVFEASEIPADSELVGRLATIVGHVRAAPAEIIGTPYASDVGDLISAGVEAVTFGPGDINNAHGVDERVSIDEVYLAACAVLELAVDLLT